MEEHYKLIAEYPILFYFFSTADDIRNLYSINIPLKILKRKNHIKVCFYFPEDMIEDIIKSFNSRDRIQLGNYVNGIDAINFKYFTEYFLYSNNILILKR